MFCAAPAQDLHINSVPCLVPVDSQLHADNGPLQRICSNSVWPPVVASRVGSSHTEPVWRYDWSSTKQCVCWLPCDCLSCRVDPNVLIPGDTFVEPEPQDSDERQSEITYIRKTNPGDPSTFSGSVRLEPPGTYITVSPIIF